MRTARCTPIRQTNAHRTGKRGSIRQKPSAESSGGGTRPEELSGASSRPVPLVENLVLVRLDQIFQLGAHVADKRLLRADRIPETELLVAGQNFIRDQKEREIFGLKIGGAALLRDRFFGQLQPLDFRLLQGLRRLFAFGFRSTGH